MEKKFSIAHEITGRIRIKISGNLGDSEWITLSAFAKNLIGVVYVRINKLANSLIIKFDNNITSKENILNELKRSFQGSNHNFHRDLKLTHQKDLFHILRSGSLLLILPVLPFTLKKILTFLSISPLLIRGIQKLLFEGIKADVLSALAVFMSYQHNKFFTTNLTYLLIELGEYLESITSKKTDDAITKLIHPKIDKVLLQKDNELIQVNIDDVLVNDIIIVNAGEIIPVDGVVVDGIASVDESSLTGEGSPVKKEKEDYVLSGTAVREGSIKIKAEKTGKDTITARISSYILSALASKSDIQNYFDKIGDRSVLVTFFIGLLSFLLTRDIKRAVSVLLVDYVCSIKLAPSVAFKSAMHLAATNGTVIKGGKAFEKLSSANIFIFDKTGTLTTDYMDISNIISFDREYKEDDLLALAASIEEHYNHPIGEAIVRLAKEKKLHHIKHSNVDYIIAHGLKTEIDNKEIVIGSRHFIEEDENISFADYNSLLLKLGEDGSTIIYVAIDKKPIGIIALKEKIRDDAKKTIQILKDSGVNKVIMLTGDEKNKANSISNELGIDEVYYELLPDEKSKIIDQLKRDKKNIIAFCGDGINDAPALSIADVSIAVYNSSDMAKDISDIVLIKNEIFPVAFARKLSIKTINKINNNFYLSVTANSLILFLASTGLIGPLTSAFLHNIFTVITLLNSILQNNHFE